MLKQNNNIELRRTATILVQNLSNQTKKKFRAGLGVKSSNRASSGRPLKVSCWVLTTELRAKKKKKKMAELQSVARIDGGNSWKGKGTMAAVAARSVWFMNRSSIPGGSITMVMKSKRKPQQYLSVRCEAAAAAAGQSNTNKTGWFIPSIVKRVREAIHRYNEERALRAHIWHVASLITHGVPEPNYDHHYPFAHWVIDEINTRESKNLQLDDIISYESQLCETGKRNMSLLAMDEQGMHIYDVVVRCHDGKEELEYSEIAWQCEETFTQGAETNMQGSQDSSMGM